MPAQIERYHEEFLDTLPYDPHDGPTLCGDVSDRYQEFLDAKGVPNDFGRAVPGHVYNRVQGYAVDWSARQFREFATAPVPLVLPEREYVEAHPWGRTDFEGQRIGYPAYQIGGTEVVRFSSMQATVRTAAAGTIWRGMRIKFDLAKVLEIARNYEDRSELPERRSERLGEYVLSLVSDYRGKHSNGLGIHWSTRPEMAGVASETQGDFRDLQVVLEARYRDSDVVPEGDPLYHESAVWVGNKTEAEVLIKPGANLEIVGLWIRDNIGTNVLSADRIPKMNIRGSDFRNLLPRPIRRTAAVSREFYRGVFTYSALPRPLVESVISDRATGDQVLDHLVGGRKNRFWAAEPDWSLYAAQSHADVLWMGVGFCAVMVGTSNGEALPPAWHHGEMPLGSEIEVSEVWVKHSASKPWRRLPVSRPRKVVTGSMQATVRTALPSWRDRGALPEADGPDGRIDVVIAPDLGRSRRNSWMVYLFGKPHARRSTLPEAKATVEGFFGPLAWTKREGDQTLRDDPVWGQTQEFNDAPYHWVADFTSARTAGARGGARAVESSRGYPQDTQRRSGLQATARRSDTGGPRRGRYDLRRGVAGPGAQRRAGAGRPGDGRDPRAGQRVAMPAPEGQFITSAPAYRNWSAYSSRTQAQALRAYRDLIEGRLRPDPKDREPLIGFYTVPIGGTVTSSGDRLVLIRLESRWRIVAIAFEHDYARVEQDIVKWLTWRAKQKRSSSKTAIGGPGTRIGRERDPRVLKAVEEFLARTEVPGLTQWDAHDQCYHESERFLALLRSKGVQAETESGYAFSEFMGQKVISQGHVGVRVGDLVYDWTRRQFDPSAPVPAVFTVAEWEADWQRLSSKTAAGQTFHYLRNTEPAPDFGSTYGQDIEPAGRYLNISETPLVHSQPNWESGTVTFTNPLVIDWGLGYGSPAGWKRQLSERYDGKTGRALSQAIRADGYDAVLTRDKHGWSEAVDLTVQ